MGALDGSAAPGAIASSAVPQGIILVYDITDEKSFENIQTWMKSIREVRGGPGGGRGRGARPGDSDAGGPLCSQNASAGVERLLLGNKCDMEAKRKVRREQADKVRGAGRGSGPGRGRGRAGPGLGRPFSNLLPAPRQLAREHGIRFFETSAKSSVNVDEVRCPDPRPRPRVATEASLRPALTAPLPARPSAPWPGTSYSSREAGER